VVSLVVDGCAQVNRCQHVAVGGVAVAQYLAQSIEWNGIMDDVALSSLDTSRVKSNCYLPYNLAVEERKASAAKHSVFVRSHKDADGPPTKLHKVELGSELHLSPEMMYASIDLPELIRRCISGLGIDIVREAVSHVVLTGGNTELNGFSSRLLKDLRTLLPNLSSLINIHTYTGSRSWDAVMGATRIAFSNSAHSESNELGIPVWMTREEYILNGPESLL